MHVSLVSYQATEPNLTAVGCVWGSFEPCVSLPLCWFVVEVKPKWL